MRFTLNDDAQAFAQANQERLVAFIAEMTAIPSPSNHEEKRAEFIRNWLHARGGTAAYIDEALNVVLPIGNVDAGAYVYMAHTDTVFPDMEALPVVVANGRISGPGVGDDTANLAQLLLWAEYILERGLQPKEGGVLIVANSGEEGLGDLKGVKALMQRYGQKVKQLVSFDGDLNQIVNRAVGSVRWKVRVKTEGGHSYARFGNPSAIARLSEMVCALYAQPVPQNQCKSTFNVGTISGGTSVNTIAQEAEMLYEYRSDQKLSLDELDASFKQIVDGFKAKGYEIEVEQVGWRPCMGDVDPAALDGLVNGLADLIEGETGARPGSRSGSTDCNIPFSMGIPAAAFGGYHGDGAHTREEYVEIDSLPIGMRCVGAVMLERF